MVLQAKGMWRKPRSAVGSREHRMPSEKDSFMTAFLYEEMAEAALSMLRQFLPRMPSTTRLNVLAFVHLIGNPAAVSADLSVDASGTLRLVLATDELAEPGPEE